MSDRRTFLKGSIGIVSGAAASLLATRPVLAGTTTAVGKYNEPDATVSRESSWSDVRAQFLLESDFTHMAGLLLSSHPVGVRKKIEFYRDALDRNPALALFKSDGDKPTLAAAAKYLAVPEVEIALVDSTTMGLGLMYGGLKLAASDHILTTTHDHYSTHEALRYAALRSGANVEKVELYKEGSQADRKSLVQSVMDRIGPNTRVVAITWVHSSSGVKYPVADLSAKMKELNKKRSRPVLLFVDGVHGFGIENVNMADLGCDVFIAGCHKWLFGPRGTGIIWANERGWEAVEPTIPSFDRDTYRLWQSGGDPSTTPKSARMSPGGFHNFESRWALAEAFNFHLNLGKDRVQTRTHELNTYAKEKLKNLKHIKLHTPLLPELSSGIITFDVRGKSANDVIQHLGKNKIIASVTPYREAFARITPAVFNNEREIDEVVRLLNDQSWLAG